MVRPIESLLRHRIARLERTSALRVPDDLAGAPATADCAHLLLDLSSNDYLGLARCRVSRETLDALDVPGGAGASRLIHGTHPTHLQLEHALANWVSQPAALLFSSGYAANVGTIAALAGPEDIIFSDELNHASLIDGCRLSRARTIIYPHLDLHALGRSLENTPTTGHRWVVTESYFSMNGDSPDLQGLASLCETATASLVVDEAHALGVFGPAGSGLLNAAGVQPDVLIGTLGKALGSQGAFVAGTPDLRLYLWNRARSLVFSTAPSPLLARFTLRQLHRAIASDDARARLHRTCTQLRQALRAAGVPVATSHGPIVPILLGDNDTVLAAAAELRRYGIRAQAIRPPTVPLGTARLRITLNATLDEAEVPRIADALTATTTTKCRAS